jgi:hypothetical protein
MLPAPTEKLRLKGFSCDILEVPVTCEYTNNIQGKGKLPLLKLKRQDKVIQRSAQNKVVKWRGEACLL